MTEIIKDIGDFEAIIFDMDGTLIDSEKVSQQMWIQTGQDYGVNLTEEMFSKMVGRNKKDLNRFLRENFGEDFPFEEADRHCIALGGEYYEQNPVPVKAGVKELLEYLKGKPEIKKAVATSNSSSWATKVLTKSELLPNFDALIFGDLIKNGKPHPEIFLIAAELVATDPAYCIAVEDSPLGVRSAHDAGMKTILIPDIIPPSKDYRELVYAKCDDMFDVLKIIS
jgi:HAD superfamily hydrolase (TIGR01509 family)